MYVEITVIGIYGVDPFRLIAFEIGGGKQPAIGLAILTK